MEMRLRFGAIFFKVESDLDGEKFLIMKRILIYAFKCLKPQLQHAEDIGDVLELISRNCSLSDITMLKFFVTEFDLREAQDNVHDYNVAIKELYKILSQFLNEFSPCQRESITIVADQDIITKDIRELSKNAFSECKKLCVSIRGRSFTITCSFPLFITQEQIMTDIENIKLLDGANVTIEYCINEVLNIAYV